MRALLLTGCMAACLATCGSALGQGVSLNAPDARINDAAIHADHQGYVAAQARMRALNDRGTGVEPKLSDYHLAKAQCWLDVSFHEYTRNDRSAFPQLALDQSTRLVEALQAGAKPLPDDTPLVNDAERLRPDLWDAASALKGHAGWRCAAAQVACAEVELVHAGNEQQQFGWRHAKPYVQIAEDLLANADAAARACPMPVVAAAPPPPAPVPPPVVTQKFNYAAEALFPFGESDQRSMHPDARREVEQTVARALQGGFEPTQVVVTGHTDRINQSGRKGFNQQLSQRRAEAVAQLLAAAGIDAGVITAVGKGDEEPVVACDGAFANAAALKACLAPNRRVEVQMTGRRAP